VYFSCVCKSRTYEEEEEDEEDDDDGRRRRLRRDGTAEGAADFRRETDGGGLAPADMSWKTGCPFLTGAQKGGTLEKGRMREIFPPVAVASCPWQSLRSFVRSFVRFFPSRSRSK